MQKDNAAQLEMFPDKRQESIPGKVSQRNYNPLRLKKIQEYQKTILSLIILIFISLISFSFGVEKGKKISADSRFVSESYKAQPLGQAAIGVAIEQPKKPAVKENAPIIKEERKPENIKVKDIKGNEKTNYTIQVASISKAKNVSLTLGDLKKKGYGAFSLPKGKYTVICVGTFALKDDANSYMQKLKYSYPDCQIRRL